MTWAEIEKSITESRRLSIEKAHKYIRRWRRPDGKYCYEYPSDQPRTVSHRQAKIAIAKRTPLITGIQPERNITRDRIDAYLTQYKKLSDQGRLRCTALGGENILITDMTRRHLYETLGEDRTEEATIRKARLLPFVPAILAHGKLCEKSRAGKRVSYSIIAQAQYVNRKGRTVIKAVELVIAYNEESKKYILSFAEEGIKKAIGSIKLR